MIKHLQSLLRWLFMRVEALFNRAFGNELNPFYHLGSITFFLYWIVAASGLYLYAFFETSVTGAYASVEYLTHEQWYAGGIMRSAHRYASDAMVLTMGVHFLRHFAFDKLRGFRWFSWITGVILIWLVLAAGINGYMLPWDKLAQFVVIATFEWLDGLPMFGGVLIRNFITQSAVNDRLFSLLSFIHIGAPLVVLMLMWIHVQRVPKASTTPPRPIVWALVMTMLVLSLVRPVLSQGGAADLGVAPPQLAFDWFYLPLFALLYLWPLGRVWALVGAGTALLAALPWLPPKFRRGGSRDFQMLVQPDQRSIKVRQGETLLEAGLRAGIALPFECRSGGCGKCRCQVVAGSVDPGIYQLSALPEVQAAEGVALMCCAVPLSDLTIVYDPTAARPVQTHTGRVDSMERLADDVMRLQVSLPAGESITFAAGQYVNIVLADGQRRAFSFANPPAAEPCTRIELHVRLVPGGRFTTQVFTTMQVGDALRLEGPFGSFTLHESEQPIIFVAGATGFAPIKSIVEDALHKGVRREMRLYWGVRQRKDLYLAELAESWQRQYPNFHFIPVLSDAGPEDAWSGRTGLVHEAILEDFPDLAGYEAYVCGSVNMVDAAFPALLGHGLDRQSCFSDAFLMSRRES